MRVIFIVATAVLLSACGPSKSELQDQLDESESRAEELSSQLDDANAKIELASDKLDDATMQLSNVQSALSDLESEQRRFAFDDWQNVVPDIRDRTGSVASAASDLEAQLLEIDSALDQ